MLYYCEPSSEKKESKKIFAMGFTDILPSPA
uniref:Uncharacterized protein n=1 Tax=Rhizophora mucronata TaxID=61149 RepID=A0A2P2NP00_RHIMU